MKTSIREARKAGLRGDDAESAALCGTDAPAPVMPTRDSDANREPSYGPGGKVAFDGIVNWMTGQGGANDISTASQWMFAATENWLSLMNIHRVSWIAKKII